MAVGVKTGWKRTNTRKPVNINANNIDDILKQEIGLVFTEILEQCGVYDRTQTGKAQFIKFLESVKTK